MTAASNLSVLEHNIVLGFGAYGEAAEAAERVFFTLLGEGVLFAERQANQAGEVMQTLIPLIRAAAAIHRDKGLEAPAGTEKECEAFVLGRLLNLEGGNRRLRPLARELQDAYPFITNEEELRPCKSK